MATPLHMRPLVEQVAMPEVGSSHCSSFAFVFLKFLICEFVNFVTLTHDGIFWSWWVERYMSKVFEREWIVVRGKMRMLIKPGGWRNVSLSLFFPSCSCDSLWILFLNTWCKSAADNDGIAHEVMLMYCAKSGWGLWNGIVVFGERQDVCIDPSWWSTTCLIVPLSLVFRVNLCCEFFGPNTWCNVLILMDCAMQARSFGIGGIFIRDRMWVLITAVGAHCLIVPLFPLFSCQLLWTFAPQPMMHCSDPDGLHERGLWNWTDYSERQDVGVDLSCWSSTCLIGPLFPWFSCECAYNPWYKSAEADGLRTKWVRFLKGICCKRQNVVMITAGEALHVSHLGSQRQSECSCWVLRTIFWTYAALSAGQP